MDIIESFEEADEIVKYGGVAHNITEEAIENDFLVYAKRYFKMQSLIWPLLTRYFVVDTDSLIARKKTSKSKNRKKTRSK